MSQWSVCRVTMLIWETANMHTCPNMSSSVHYQKHGSSPWKIKIMKCIFLITRLSFGPFSVSQLQICSNPLCRCDLSMLRNLFLSHVHRWEVHDKPQDHLYRSLIHSWLTLILTRAVSSTQHCFTLMFLESDPVIPPISWNVIKHT